MAKKKSKPAKKAAPKPVSKIFRARRKPLKKAPIVTLTVRSSLLKPPEKKERTAPVPPLSNDQIQKFRDVLSQKRDDLAAIVQRKKEEEVEDIGVGDEADIATHSVEKEMLFELTDSEKQTLDMVEAALRKMEKGFYGVCESCQKGIPRMRLQVMPWARYCISCQSEQEVPAGE
jgi:DnaK suppressor protein